MLLPTISVASDRDDEKLYKLLIRRLSSCEWNDVTGVPGTHEQQLKWAFRFVAKLNEMSAEKCLPIHFTCKLRDADTLNIMKTDDTKRYSNSGLYCILKIVEVKN